MRDRKFALPVSSPLRELSGEVNVRPKYNTPRIESWEDLARSLKSISLDSPENSPEDSFDSIPGPNRIYPDMDISNRRKSINTVARESHPGRYVASLDFFENGFDSATELSADTLGEAVRSRSFQLSSSALAVDLDYFSDSDSSLCSLSPPSSPSVASVDARDFYAAGEYPESFLMHSELAAYCDERVRGDIGRFRKGIVIPRDMLRSPSRMKKLIQPPLVERPSANDERDRLKFEQFKTDFCRESDEFRRCQESKLQVFLREMEARREDQRQRDEEARRKEAESQRRVEEARAAEEAKMRKEAEVKAAEEAAVRRQQEEVTRQKEQVKQQKADARRAVEDASRQERVASASVQKLADEKKSKTKLDKKLCKQRREESFNYLAQVETLANSFEQLAGASGQRTQVIKIRAAVGRKVSQTAKTRAQVQKKIEELSGLLSQSRQIGQEAYVFCMLKIALRIVEQADCRLTKAPEMTFAFGALINGLCAVDADFGKVVLAELHRQCPFTTPFVPRPNQYPSKSEYFTAMSYNPDASRESVFEDGESYVLRMCGYVRMLAGWLQTPVNGDHPAGGLAAGWEWLARMSNRSPSGKHPEIVAAFLEASGYALCQAYGPLFHKFMEFLCNIYMPKVNDEASRFRLKLFIDAYVAANNSVPEPPGRSLPENQSSDTSLLSIYDGDEAPEGK
eukprot:99230_1